MKNIIEALGDTLNEIIGAAVVFAGLSGAVILLRNFGDVFISYFL